MKKKLSKLSKHQKESPKAGERQRKVDGQYTNTPKGAKTAQTQKKEW